MTPPFCRWMGYDHFVARNGSKRNVASPFDRRRETVLAVYAVLTALSVLGKIHMVPTEADRDQETPPVNRVFPNPLSPPRMLKTPSQEAAVLSTSGMTTLRIRAPNQGAWITHPQKVWCISRKYPITT